MSFASTFVAPFADPDTTGKVIQNQVAFSSYTINNANEFLGALQDSISTDAVVVDSQNIANPDFALASLSQLNALLSLLGATTITPPVITDVQITPPNAPSDPEFTDAPDIVIPEFRATAPTLTMPTLPNASPLNLPAPPSITDVDIPSAPTLSFPTAPTFDVIQLPQPPSIAIPSFTSTLPVDSLVVPTNTFSWFETAYSSTLLDAAKAKLLDNIQNGGYGIETADEAALWDRERGRQVEATNAQIDEIYRNAAARGFPLPPGDINVAVQRALQDSSDKVSTTSREIALKRADMYVENRKFTITEARSLESVLIGYHSSVQERSLNAAKSVLQLAIELFNASVARYNAQLDAYKTEASVFESKIRATLAQVEIYRTTMEGKRIELAAQTQQVELYRAQLAGINTIVDIYKSQVEAQVQRANIQRVKTELFRAQIDAYAAQVQTQVAGAQIYEAQTRGQVARVQAYEAEARAYVAQVEGAKARSDTLLGNLRLQVEQAQARSKVYESSIIGYRAQVDKQIEQIRANLLKYSTDAQVLGVRGQIYGDAARVGIEQVRTESAMRSKALDIVIENARNQITALGKSADIKVSANETVGRYITAAVASSIGALNTISAITRQT